MKPRFSITHSLTRADCRKYIRQSFSYRASTPSIIIGVLGLLCLFVISRISAVSTSMLAVWLICIYIPTLLSEFRSAAHVNRLNLPAEPRNVCYLFEEDCIRILIEQEGIPISRTVAYTDLIHVKQDTDSFYLFHETSDAVIVINKNVLTDWELSHLCSFLSEKTGWIILPDSPYHPF